MRKRSWLFWLGAVLLTGAATSVVIAAQQSAARTPAKKKSSASSKAAKKSAKRTPRAQTAPTPDRIREIQTALKREGALNQEPTGMWDSTTVEAMKKYQGDHGLSPTGKIDALTLIKLGLGPDTAGKGAPKPLATSSDPPSKSVP